MCTFSDDIALYEAKKLTLEAEGKKPWVWRLVLGHANIQDL